MSYTYNLYFTWLKFKFDLEAVANKVHYEIKRYFASEKAADRDLSPSPVLETPPNKLNYAAHAAAAGAASLGLH